MSSTEDIGRRSGGKFFSVVRISPLSIAVQLSGQHRILLTVMSQAPSLHRVQRVVPVTIPSRSSQDTNAEPGNTPTNVVRDPSEGPKTPTRRGPSQTNGLDTVDGDEDAGGSPLDGVGKLSNRRHLRNRPSLILHPDAGLLGNDDEADVAVQSIDKPQVSFALV